MPRSKHFQRENRYKGNPPQLFSCDRKIPYCDDTIKFLVEADTGETAGIMAEELAYAVAWHRGAIPTADHKGRSLRVKRPETWAREVTHRGGVIPLAFVKPATAPELQHNTATLKSMSEDELALARR